MVLTPSSETISSSCESCEETCLFRAELNQLRKEISLLRQQVRTDALTDLYNFRFFSDTLPLEMERSRRSFQPLSLIVLDVDYFKKFNDRWGHELGNRALVQVASLITQTVRKLDYACRFGGEEFVVILPNTDLRQAISVADRLRDIIATTPLIHENTDPIFITASLGVDEFRSHHSDTPQGFIERVDSWLYTAKNGGRNQVAHPSLALGSALTTTVTPDEKDALFSALDEKE